MASDGFEVERWVARLATALEGLANIQQDYWKELYGRNADGSHARDSRDPSDAYRRFYRRASETESHLHKGHYGPVRAALAEVLGILSRHPAWAEPLEASGDGQIWFEFPNSADRKSLLPVVAGLMARPGGGRKRVLGSVFGARADPRTGG